MRESFPVRNTQYVSLSDSILERSCVEIMKKVFEVCERLAR